MGDDFNGFGGAPAQGMYIHYVSSAHVGEQAADGGLLGKLRCRSRRPAPNPHRRGWR